MSHDDSKKPGDSPKSGTSRENGLEHGPTQVSPAPGFDADRTGWTGAGTGTFAPLAPGDVIGGRYRLLALLGQGGMGAVYRAHDELLETEVALKILRPEVANDFDFLKRFRNELLLARKVSHRHVVRNHDVGEHQGLHFMTMDLVTGQPLDQVLKERGSLPLAEAMRIVRQVASALAEAHRQGIIHRDLKPANILLDEAGDAYVSDFGVARSLASSGLTRTGEIVGTPHYLSPEQARGEKVDGRSDLFTLGIIFIQLLSGQVPSTGNTLLEIVSQRMNGRLRTLGELGVRVPAPVEDVMARLVHKDPEARFSRAEDLVAALDDLRDDGRSRARRAETRPARPVAARTASSSVGPAGTSRATVWAALAATGLALLIFLAVRFFSPKTPAENPPVPADSTANAAAPSHRTAAERSPSLPAPEPRHSIAVLPFPEDGGSPRLAWAANGVADMLASALAENQLLRVIDSVRVFQTLDDLGFEPARMRREERQQLADFFQVDRLVFGELSDTGGGLELVMHLMETDRPGTPPRRIATATGNVRELFKLVDRLETALRGELALDAAKRPESSDRADVSARALQAYTEGLEALSRRETLKAAPALERAVAEAPQLTAAWVRLSQAYQSLGRATEALDAARKAVANLPEGRIGFEARAQEALLRGEPEAAQGFLEDLVERYPNDAQAQVDLAEAYASQGRLDDAVALLGRVVRLDASDPRAWYLLGRYSILSGDSRTAVEEHLPRALEQQAKLNNEQGQAEVYNALGVGYDRLGNLEQAVESYRLAAEIRDRIGDQRGHAVSLNNLAHAHLRRGDLEAAEENIRQALSIHRELENQAGMGKLLNMYGVLEEERGRFAEALEHYRRALQIREDLGDQRALAESYNNMGYAYYLLAEYENAMLYLERSLELFRQNEDSAGLIPTLQSIGDCRLAQGRLKEALGTLLESLELARQVEWKEPIAVARVSLGRLAHLQGRYGAALTAYREAHELLTELGNRIGLVEVTRREAATLLEVGALDRAARRLSQLATWMADEGQHKQKSQWLVLQGREALARGDLEAARPFLEQAWREAESRQSPTARIAARHALGRVALADDRLADAREQLEAAFEEARRIGHWSWRLVTAESLARLELAAEKPAVAAKLLRDALRLSEENAFYGRAHHLYRLLAEALDREGDATGAARARERAHAEVERLRLEIDEDLRASFERQVE